MTALYLDTSALFKLVRAEAESGPLRDFLEQSDEPVMTSLVGSVELQRAAARHGESALVVAHRILSRTDVLGISQSIASTAGLLTPPGLRSLDAFHIASAMDIRDDLTAVVAYDVRLLRAALSHGLPVRYPGLTNLTCIEP